MNRTIVTPSDTLSFVRTDDECWAVYRGYRFRVVGDGGEQPWRTYIVNPEGNAVIWHTVGPFDEHQNDHRPWTTKFKGWNIGRVVKKVQKYIDTDLDKQKAEAAKWPTC